MTNLQNALGLFPTAHIAFNKSRLKIHKQTASASSGDTDGTVYLKDGQEFEFELFNPTKDTILCKIEINNKAVSQGGLVLRPGQRYFLDRYLDVARKFKFETYEVEGDNDQVKEAIKNNGDVVVRFYREKEKPAPLNVYFDRYYYNQDYGSGLNVLHSDFGSTNSINSFPTLGSTAINSFHCSTAGADRSFSGHTLSFDGAVTTASYNTAIGSSALASNALRSVSKKTETGRVEKGSKSDQKFKTVDLDFEYSAFTTVKIKLLPISQQVVEELNITVYCTECGAKQKKGNKFCPKCGNKH